jgi:hypothetical protein
VAWIDDELTDDSKFTAWARRQPGLLAIGPDPRRGLTMDDLRAIDRWLLEDATMCLSCGNRMATVRPVVRQRQSPVGRQALLRPAGKGPSASGKGSGKGSGKPLGKGAAGDCPD